MTLSRLFLFPVCLAALFLTGCPTDAPRDRFDYLRSPVTFRIDPVADNHPFCSDGNNVGAGKTFATIQECQETRKYRLKWDRPEDTVGFSEYRIFVDTTPPNAPDLKWSDVQKDPTLASIRLSGKASSSDSIIFVLAAGAGSDPVQSRTNPRIMRLDTTGRIDSLGKLVFAISTGYRTSGLNGQPRYTWVITNDRFAPYPLQPAFAAKARAVEISWTRPGDPTSFFDPDADSGLIRGYSLRVVRGGNAKSTIPFNPVVTLYSVGGVNRTVEVKADSFKTSKNLAGRVFWLPDSQRVFNRYGDDARDSLRATVSGLSPQDTVDIALWAVDVSGNTTDSSSNNRKFLTDTTQPTTPVLQLVNGSLSRNGFVYTFTASRDLVESGSGLAPASTPNANIREYLLTRTRTTGTASVVDSVFKIAPSQRSRETFTDTVRYLPPGTGFKVSVYAVDSTGHASAAGFLNVTTPTAAFTGPDSGATCPTGFIPVPSGRFQFGSTASTDEGPAQTRGIGSYCIEPYEHRASGAFQTQVTWEKARDVCAAVSPGNESHLCTEGEWERACEGTESVPLVYGIQSEARNPSNVRFACNIGTNDSAMANNLSLRDPTCLSYDGVFDMSGNFAEWVLDPYTDTYPSADTLIVGQPHTTPVTASRRGFRGTHYLNTSRTPAVMQSAGRCSNRDYAAQLRPKPYAGCTSETNPKLVVTYATKPPRCFTLPDSLQGRAVSSVTPGRDTNQIFILLPGQKSPVVFTMPADTAYRLVKPLSGLLSSRDLAIVTFVNSETSETIVDTLDATELVNASEATLNTIFAREAAAPWSVKRVNGRYEIRYLYSYSVSQKITARKFYANALIGFRCCSKPVPATLGKRRALQKR
jgi:formylglycine-generating enzyme required for sulfatase activity